MENTQNANRNVAIGLPDGITLPSADELMQIERQIARDYALKKTRAAINAVAAPPSREGVMADALAYFVTQQAQAAVAIAKAATIADVKAAFAEQAKIGQVLLGLMAEGKLVFPYQAKQLDGAGILADLVRVSNGVSSALAQAADT